MSTNATTPTTEQIWAEALNPEQLAARLIEYAGDIRWGPMPQRVALLKEAASRLFEGTPKLAKAPLPAKAQATATEPAPPAADSTDEGESAVGTGRTGRGRTKATGDPRADRAAAGRDQDTRRAMLDEMVLSVLRSYPAGQGRQASKIRSDMGDTAPEHLATLTASLRRLVKAGQAFDQDGAYGALPASTEEFTATVTNILGAGAEK